MQNTLHFRDNAVTFSVSGLPMVGNLDTGGVIGLTADGEELCARLAEVGISSDEVPESCTVLLAHLEKGEYLSSSCPKTPRQTTLQSAYLHVTQRCNLACRFCYSEDASRNASDDPSLEDLYRAINLLADLGCSRLIISGGEPFLRNDLTRIASHAKGHGIKSVAILTNGICVTREHVEPLSGMVDSIAVAFDGCSQDSPAHLRGEQRFTRLVEAVQAVHDCGIVPVILPTIHAKNLEDIPKYKELATDLGAQAQFSLLTTPSEELESFALNEEHLRRLAALSAQAGASIQDSAVGGSITVRRWCGAGVRILSIAADGTVYPCHMLHRPAFAMGNAFAHTAERIRSSEVAHSFGELTVDTFEQCSSCELRYLCGGGCRAKALFDTGKIQSCDPCCELYRVCLSSRFKSLKQQFGIG